MRKPASGHRLPGKRCVANQVDERTHGHRIGSSGRRTLSRAHAALHDGGGAHASRFRRRRLRAVYLSAARGPDRVAAPEWSLVPGAKGCTPESCEFRDLAKDYVAIGYRIHGLSRQDTAYQREAVARLHLPYSIALGSLIHLGDCARAANIRGRRRAPTCPQHLGRPRWHDRLGKHRHHRRGHTPKGSVEGTEAGAGAWTTALRLI